MSQLHAGVHRTPGTLDNDRANSGCAQYYVYFGRMMAAFSSNFTERLPEVFLMIEQMGVMATVSARTPCRIEATPVPSRELPNSHLPPKSEQRWL